MDELNPSLQVQLEQRRKLKQCRACGGTDHLRKSSRKCPHFKPRSIANLTLTPVHDTQDKEKFMKEESQTLKSPRNLQWVKRSTRRHYCEITSLQSPPPQQLQSFPVDSNNNNNDNNNDNNKSSNCAPLIELEKSVILERTPRRIQDQFGEVGFVPWTTRGMPRSLLSNNNKHIYSPVLILSPFDLTLGNNVREAWMKMFERASTTADARPPSDEMNTNKTKSQSSRKKIKWKILVYHYSEVGIVSNAFSLADPESFVKYHEGVERGFEFLPNLMEKRDRDALNKREERHLEAIYQIRIDSTLPKMDRGGSMFFPYGDTARPNETVIINAPRPSINRGTNVWAPPPPLPE